MYRSKIIPQPHKIEQHSCPYPYPNDTHNNLPKVKKVQINAPLLPKNIHQYHLLGFLTSHQKLVDTTHGILPTAWNLSKVMVVDAPGYSGHDTAEMDSMQHHQYTTFTPMPKCSTLCAERKKTI